MRRSTEPSARGTEDAPVCTGALVLSSSIKTRTTISGSYGPFEVLRTIEDVFGVSGLGRSQQAQGLGGKLFR